MKEKTLNEIIIEKRLGIPPDYQFKALNQSNFFQSNWHYNKLIALDYLLKFEKSHSILDIGTGSGNFEITFANKVKNIVGIDYNDGAIDFLQSELKRRNISNVELINEDVRKLKISDNFGKFDFILMVDFIEHLKISDIKKLIKDFKGLLKPNGKFCIITPNYKSLWFWIEKILDKLNIIPFIGGKQHLSQFHKKNITEIFNQEGYSLMKYKTFNLFSFLSPFKIFSGILCKIELNLPLSTGNLIFCVFESSKT